MLRPQGMGDGLLDKAASAVANAEWLQRRGLDGMAARTARSASSSCAVGQPK